MKYNLTVEAKINGFSNSEFCKSTTKEGIIFDNQIDAAKDIIKSFTAHAENEMEMEARNNHVVLVAKMQSGKTGTCNAVVNILKKTNLNTYFGINKCFFISGMNDTGLHTQTTKRLAEQVLDATNENMCVGIKEYKDKKNASFFVFKNSDLKNANLQLSNCLIFVDEAHFGSGETNVLTQFLNRNNINWKNRNCLKEKNIYIVSVSATPFDELISDLADCKSVVVLNNTPNYVGITEYLENKKINDASSDDFIEQEKNNPAPLKLQRQFSLPAKIKYIPVVDYIKTAHERMVETNGKGILFIRSRNTDIKFHDYITKNFKKIDLDMKLSGSIDYDLVGKTIQSMIDAPIGSPESKPVIFFMKGAFRAGISIETEHKDYVYMVYDNSNKPEATAQGLLGRMCGYRNMDNNNYLRTSFYVNTKWAKQYSDWESNFTDKTNIPSQRKNKTVTLEEYMQTPNSPNMRISTQAVGNIFVDLTDEQIKRFVQAEIDKNIINSDFCRTELKRILPDLEFDYLDESLLKGINNYKDSIVERWFNYETQYCNSYRPDGYFKQLNGRKELTIEDANKKIIHAVLDAEIHTDSNNNILSISGNKKMIIQRGTLSIQIKNPSPSMIKAHKNTNL